MSVVLDREDINQLAEVLLKTDRKEWVSVISNHFEADGQLVEMIYEGWNELEPEHFKRIIEEASEIKKSSGYIDYFDGQVLKPTEEDIRIAEENMAKAEEHSKELQKKLEVIEDNPVE